MVVGLHGRMLCYMVGCWVTWWVLFDSIVGSVGLHGGDCWVTWWGVLHYIGGVLGYMV